MSSRILVIDDEEAVRDAFELALEDEGHHVEVAASGEEGLEKARAARPDLVFLDLKMPGIGGVETLRRLLEHDADLVIYIVTAFYKEFMGELAQAREAGATFQIAAKPLQAEQIREIVRASLARDE